MTDLDSPRRNNDCYFYYYSTCAKGDSCTFRHEPSALGCETMCSFWKEGKCLNIHCNFRHMELRKNRKAIQCYWETQPGGCLKPHCPFLHQNVKQSLASYGDNRIGQNTDTVQTGKPNDTLQAPEKNYKSSVDPLVVNFEEESDTESAPSPIKIRRANVKTLEEIKLERIQEESAAYFSFNDAAPPPSFETEDDLRHRLLYKMKRKQLIEEDNSNVKRTRLNFSSNTSLDDHIKILSSKKEMKPYKENNTLEDDMSKRKRLKIRSLSRKSEKGVNNIKIKTLDEIRAERLKRRGGSACLTESENVVTSTSRDEIVPNTSNKVQAQLSPLLSPSNNTFVNDTIETNSVFIKKDIEHNKMSIDIECTEYFEKEIDELKDCPTQTPSPFIENQVNTILSRENNQVPIRIENNDLNKASFDSPMEQSENNSETISNGSDPSSNKLAEEVLLLDDDEDYANVNMKAEDELLDEIDDILGN